jgi:hypothetical protein
MHTDPTTAGAVFTPGAGAAAFWVRYPSALPGGGNTLGFTCRGSNSNDYVQILRTGSGAGWSFDIRHNTGGGVSLIATGTTITTATAYFVVVQWDSATTSRRIRVFTDPTSAVVAEAVDTSTNFSANVPADFNSGTGLRFGDNTGATTTHHIDNVFCGSAYADGDEFITNASITSYSNYVGGTPPASVKRCMMMGIG